MPSTYTTSLKLELIANGEQANTWGDTTNNNLGTLIEQAITGVQSIALIGDTTLTSYNGLSDQARNAVLLFSGSLSNTANVTVPAAAKTYIVQNKAGANVHIKTSTANGIVFANNTSGLIYCDGSSFYVAVDPNNITSDLTVSGNQTVTGSLTAGGNIVLHNTIASNNNTLSLTSATGIVDMTTNTGAFTMPYGATGDRPASPDLGTTRWNSTGGYMEIWNGVQWQNITGNYSIDYLMIAGGGGGNTGAGGGAGGLIANSTTVTVGTAYSITVGSGGAGAGAANATKGSNTTAFSLTAIGGGYAGGAAGGNGGSGGGGSTVTLPSPSYVSGGSGTAGQGYAGGASGYNYQADLGGGGGGAGAVGTAGIDNTTGGNGGNGVSSSITGTATYYAGGGYGRITGGANAGQTGTAGLGQGTYGGGGLAAQTTGTSGKNGVVIIRYASSIQRATGGTVTNYSNSGVTYFVHTFTTSGTFTA